MLPLVYIVVTVLTGLLFFLIPGFGSDREKISSRQMFLFHFFSSFSFYQSIFCEFVCLRGF